MRTTCKMYKFTLILDRPIPDLTDDTGCMKFRTSCRSIQGAEKYARKHAEIIGCNLAKPVRCIIEYNTTAGKKTREITFEEA